VRKNEHHRGSVRIRRAISSGIHASLGLSVPFDCMLFATSAARVSICEPQKGNERLLLPNAKGGRLSVHGVQHLLKKHSANAARSCPSLKGKRVSVHLLRHTMALELLQAGVDRAVIAMWLGHESVETTQVYLEATLAMKEQALAKTSSPHGTPSRYRRADQLLTFLDSL
jgi:hypothetical protein